MSDERHKPGTAYVCDARRFGGDRQLCPVHMAAVEMRDILEQIIADGGYDDDGDFYLYRRDGPTKESDYLDPLAIERAKALLTQLPPRVVTERS